LKVQASKVGKYFVEDAVEKVNKESVLKVLERKLEKPKYSD
jgi:hypothetical protein